MTGLGAKKKKSVMGTKMNTTKTCNERMESMRRWDNATKRRKRKIIKVKSRREQIKMVHDKGLEICRKLGHLKNKHYNTKKKRIEKRCSRCGKLLKVMDKEEI